MRSRLFFILSRVEYLDFASCRRVRLPWASGGLIFLISTVSLVEATNDRVYCSTTGGLFYYNLEDNLVEKISKIDGLSDNGVSAMRWSSEHETLILAYESSNLDIIRGGSVVEFA